MFLVDTSVWIELFRRRPSVSLDQVGGLEEVVTCLPVIQEVLQGFDDPSAYRIAREAMFALPIVESPLSSTLVEEAVDLYRSARRAGVTPRSSVDCLIAACALRHELPVAHCDRDYAQLARVSALRELDLQAERRR